MNGVTLRETPELLRANTALRIAAIIGTVVVAASYGCGSSSTTLLQPSNDRCAIGMPTSPPPVGASGGTGTLNITAARECVWSAASDAPWLTITSEASGQGNGAINYAVASNPAPSMRRGAVAVGAQRTEIMQSAAPCLFRFTPAGQSFDVGGGEGAIGVETVEGCSWTASSGASWIAIVATQNTNGPGTVRFGVDANTGDARTSSITIGGQTFPVTQAGISTPQCSFRIDPATHTAPTDGGTSSIAVAATPGCAWTAASQSPWITIASSASGSGDGTVTVRIAANPGAQRVGTVTIANAIYTVTQSAALVCTYAIAPPTFSAPATAATTTVAVTAPNGCSWTAASQAGWITVTNGASGNGNGTVSLAIAANTGATRSGTVTIGGQIFSVSQAAIACTYSIAPNALSPPAAGATASVAVTAPAGCTWTAASQLQWISITSGATGSGNGTVSLTVAANTATSPRTGTATIAGRTYTVTQAAAQAPCTYSIAPSEQSVPAAGGNIAVTVTAAAECAWTASSQVQQWITIASGASGSGNGTVNLTIAANTGPARTGAATIAGQTFTVMQAAEPPPCAYAIAPSEQSVAAMGGAVVVTVTAAAGCAWTAATDPQTPWVTIDRGGAGSGNGTVEMTVARNTGPARTATVVIANQPFRVNQAADAPVCTYAFDPPSQAATSAGGEFAVVINTQGSCSWSVTSTVQWITFVDFPTGVATGTGGATVKYRVSPNNTSSSRVGTLEGSGQVLTVTQAFPF